MDNLIEKYPNINFTVNLTKIPFTTWIQIGECLSKIEHISKIPLKPNISEEMHRVYLIKGVQATTAIEGNTLTEEEVRLRVENKLKLPPSKEYLGKEVDNITFLCNEIKDKKIVEEKEHLINVKDIQYYNKKILEEIPVAEHVNPGEFRKCSVVIGNYRGPDYNDVPILMEKYCEWLNTTNFTVCEDRPALNSIIKAIAAHVYFVLIHPFGDGNGRTARMIEFYILLSSGFPSPTAQLLSNHYNATRNEYYRELENATKTRELTSFITYAVRGFLDSLREQLDYIFKFVFDLSWESYIYEVFREHKHNEVTTKRRRTLVLELSKAEKPVVFEELLSLSRSIIDAYRNKTRKTLSRDLHEIEAIGLIISDKKTYKANKEKIRAFLPLSNL
jgi:Fic family protein